MCRRMEQAPDLPADVAARVVELDSMELERAIMLLGHLRQGRLKAKSLAELAQLLGLAPGQAEAAEWKTVLKGLRRDEIFSGEPLTDWPGDRSRDRAAQPGEGGAR